MSCKRNNVIHFAIIFSVFLCSGFAFGNDAPSCLVREAASSTEAVLRKAGTDEHEVLTRLVYAESISTGFVDDQSVYEAIAWGVLNRVRLGEVCPLQQKVYGRGIWGVIFKKGQFNPAVSVSSPFSKEFLCPADPVRWHMAASAVRNTRAGKGNPFIQTPWEKEHGISLVVNFYYPQSVQARSPLAPWEESTALTCIGDVQIGDGLVPAQKVRFYRLNAAPCNR